MFNFITLVGQFVKDLKKEKNLKFYKLFFCFYGIFIIFIRISKEILDFGTCEYKFRIFINKFLALGIKDFKNLKNLLEKNDFTKNLTNSLKLCKFK